MAAPMRNAFWRSIYGNILKIHNPKHYVPAAAFCEEAMTNRIRPKFDVLSLATDAEHETEVSSVEDVHEKKQSFATMFRKSRLVQMGDLKDKTMAGRIIDVVQDDLYIDFGGKFYCVCPRPSFQADQYVKGQRVKVLMHKFEMSSSFMGSEKHVTLLEADCTLMGSFDPSQREQSNLSASTGFASRMLAVEDSAKDNEEAVQESEGKIETIVTKGSVETEEVK
ncbi:28S ribosomal protein S28, mitochondrial-like [Mercenaria mercenaria]|uniref:28S ribosomal protein S28, mitochondrial-like n=1 Tax=Mercenaria mercenaria TaxID=6596 RepID=UPI00234F32E7|nr:28S ribosomal protein S28, mitochondrial-like [Mercenaria mercenaria]